MRAHAATSLDRYTQALSKGGALIDETRLLLRAWSPGETEAELAQRALDTNLLGRATARRVLDIVRVFALRFLAPTDEPARHLRHITSSAQTSSLFSDLVFLYTVRRDPLLRDFVADVYWPAVREGRLIMTNTDVMQLVRSAEIDGRITMPWSDEIRRDMCGRVMIALTDFGLLRPVKPAVRDVASYHPHNWTLVYLAYLLHGKGVTDSSLTEAKEWSWFGLQPEETWDHLSALAGEGWFLLQRAGDVKRITWLYPSMESILDEFTRREL